MYDTAGGNSPRLPVGKSGEEMLAAMSEHHTPITDMTLRLLEARAADSVLDIGCGGGRALKRLSRIVTDGKLTGVDYSETAVECTRKENLSDVESGKMTVVQGSVSDLPFAENSFDRICSIESYFFWPDLKNDLKEVLRVLKPGGRAVIASCFKPARKQPEEYEALQKNLDMHIFSAEDFVTLLQEAGFCCAEAHIEAGDGEQYFHLCAVGRKPGGALTRSSADAALDKTRQDKE